MINKLLDEPYWSELSDLMKPYVLELQKKGNFYDTSVNDPVIVAILFIQEMAENKVVGRFAKRCDFLSLAQFNMIETLIKDNLVEIREVLATRISEEIMMLKRRTLEEKGLSRTDVRIESELEQLRVYEEIIREQNFHLIFLRHREVFSYDK